MHSVGARSAAKVLTAKMFEVELLRRLVLCPQQMANGVAAYKVADLFGSVFHMVSGPFDGLGH